MRDYKVQFTVTSIKRKKDFVAIVKKMEEIVKSEKYIVDWEIILNPDKKETV